VSTLKTVESDIVNIAKEVKAGIEVAGEDALKLAAFLQKNQGTIAALAALAGSKSSNVEQTSLQVLTLAINAVKGTSDAAAANGVNVNLDSAAVAAVKALIADLEKL
jgi:hypothetical protein